MNEDKKTQIKEALDEAKNKLEELKKLNPNGNYEDLEKMIQSMNNLLNQEQKKFNFFSVVQLILLLVLPYIGCTIGVVVILGFFNFLLKPVEPTSFISIIPLTSLVLFLTYRIENVILNHMNLSHPFLSLFFINIMKIFLLAIVEQNCLHLCDNLGNSLCLLSVLVFVGFIIDLFCAKKIFYYLGEKL